jgi:hypothetical protein
MAPGKRRRARRKALVPRIAGRLRRLLGRPTPASGAGTGGSRGAGGAGKRGRHQEARHTPGQAGLPSLAPGQPVAELARALAIGARSLFADAPEGFDVPEDEIERLLAAVAAACEERALASFVQVPAACLPLTAASVAGCRQRIGRRPRFRLLVLDPEGRIVENIGIDVWVRRRSTFVAVADDAPVKRVLAMPPGGISPAAAVGTHDLPIDAVYTWVDAADPAWQELFARYVDPSGFDPDRFAQSDELRYSLRSLDVFAPWIRRIHILSNCAPPSWFRPSERVVWLDHADVIDSEVLPLFNSGAIESFLHRIPGLSEHFVYLNDDFVLWDSVTPGTFFTRDGRTIAHLQPSGLVPYFEQLTKADLAVPWQWSRVNSARLFEQRYGVYPTRIHQHVPYALRRSVMEELEREFPAEIAALRSARVRDRASMSFVGFLYHHYAQLDGRAVVESADYAMVVARTYRQKRLRQRLASVRFVCLNEGRGSSDDQDFQEYKRRILDAALPIPSAAEEPDGIPAVRTEEPPPRADPARRGRAARREGRRRR